MDRIAEAATGVLADRPHYYGDISAAPDGRHLASAAVRGDRVSIWDWRAGKPVLTLVLAAGDSPAPLAISPEGHHRMLGEASEQAAPALVYVVQTGEGQSWLPLEEFTRRGANSKLQAGHLKDPAAGETTYERK